MEFLTNLHGSVSSKQITTGLALGASATALIGACYYLTKRGGAVEMAHRVSMEKGDWEPRVVETNMAANKFPISVDLVNSEGDHEPKSQSINPITSLPVFPYIGPRNNTLLTAYLQEDVYDQLRYLKTVFGSTLDECIQVGVDNPEGDVFADSCNPHAKSCGFVAADAQCYAMFEKLFAPIVFSCHQILGTTAPVCDPVESPTFKVSAIEVRVHRNLTNIPFAPRISRFQRRYVFNTVAEMCEAVEPGIKIYLLSDTPSPTEVDKLRRLNLFKDITIDNPYRVSIGQYRDPLDARAIALSEDEAVAVVVNSLDHLVFIGRENGGSIEKAYRTIKGILDQSEAWLRDKGYEFAFNEKFGYLTVLPEVLGTGVTINCRLSFADRHGGENFASKIRMLLIGSGLNVTKQIDERDSAGWMHYDVETVETFVRGQDGFGVQSAMGYFSSVLNKVQEEWKL